MTGLPEGQRVSQKSEARLKTEKEIRQAFEGAENGSSFIERLAAKNLSLAVAKPTDVLDSEKQLKEKGLHGKPLKEGEIVVLNEQGHVFRLKPKMIGASEADIKQKMGLIDRGELLSVKEAQSLLRVERQKARDRFSYLAHSTRRKEHMRDYQITKFHTFSPPMPYFPSMVEIDWTGYGLGLTMKRPHNDDNHTKYPHIMMGKTEKLKSQHTKGRGKAGEEKVKFVRRPQTEQEKMDADRWKLHIYCKNTGEWWIWLLKYGPKGMPKL